jgi:hypothetical protein
MSNPAGDAHYPQAAWQVLIRLKKGWTVAARRTDSQFPASSFLVI